MKRILWAALALTLLLSACQTKTVPVTIFADGQTFTLDSAQRVPADLLAEAGLALGPDDRVFHLGSPTPPDVALVEASSYTLTVRRAVTVTLVTPEGTRILHTSAASVGQALTEAGVPLAAADRADPPVEAPLVDGLTVTWQPASPLTITVDGQQVQTRSAAATVGQALTEAGIPLVGLDYAVPSAESPLPADGQIRVVRVVENVTLVQKTLPYTSRAELTAELELDQQGVLQAGAPGLAVSRVRVRSEDGTETARTTEGETVVRPAQDRVIGYGTKIVIRTEVVDGTTITYWRKLNVYVTAYSPCASGGAPGQCYTGTSSGLPAGKGVIAMVYSWYLLFGGQNLYVPGYGTGVVGDTGGGAPAGNHYWIDLGYSDGDPAIYSWGRWVTVYFLVPAEANPGYILP